MFIVGAFVSSPLPVLPPPPLCSRAGNVVARVRDEMRRLCRVCCVLVLDASCAAAGCFLGPSGKHLPSVIPAQLGPQEQDRVKLPARHDVCR